MKTNIFTRWTLFILNSIEKIAVTPCISGMNTFKRESSFEILKKEPSHEERGVGVAAASAITVAIFSAPASGKTRRSTEFLGDARHNALRMLEEGKQIFRFDTFGDEQFWTGQLRLNEAVETLSPRAALGLGLKVDSDSLPPPIIQAIRRGQINLDAPAVAAVEFELGRRRDRVFRFRRTMTIKRSRSDLRRMSFDHRRLGDREYRT